MIEVTQKNRKGTVIILAQLTDEEFGKHYDTDYITKYFSTSPIMVGSEMVYRAWDVYVGVRIPIFKIVAYNHKGKILHPSHLIGICRKYNPLDILRQKWREQACAWGFKRSHGGWRKYKTFQEIKWNHAWDDEEFCPKVRGRRDTPLMPDPWNNERYVHVEKNWKKFRKHQWKNDVLLG